MFRAHRVSRVASFVLIASAALTQACSDASSPKTALDSASDGRKAAEASATIPAKECATPASGWIFCDDFETDRSAKYFEIDNAGGKFARVNAAGWGGSVGMRATFTSGQSNAGHMSLAFGKVPSTYFRTVDAGAAKYREIYWRFFLRRETGWVGNGAGNLTRAMTFANSSWSQGMLAIASSNTADSRFANLDAFSGTDAAGNLVTTRYNDAAHFRSLSSIRSTTAVDDPSTVGQWACYEFHVKLNDAGQSNGIYEMSVNGQLAARASGLNWVGAYSTYGINAINLENFYASGTAPAANMRIFDNLVVSTLAIGCGAATLPPPATVATVSVAIDSSSLMIGHQANASATLKDANGNVLSGTVTWSSSNTAVATVSPTGQVTGMGAGTANIMASNSGKTGQAGIQVVVAPVTVGSVGVSLAANSISIGGTTQGTATVFDGSGNVLTGQAVTWTSSNTAVATVSNTGLVTAVAIGSANVTAASGGKSGQATLTVTAIPVASVGVSLAATSITTGATTQATAMVFDAGGNVLTGQAVTWTSSNTAVATVSNTGLVTAVAVGSANITAASGGKSGQATLTVTAIPVASVSVALAASSLTAGGTTQATATTRDASGNVLTGRPVTWTSSNTAIATVTSAGVVTAVAAGSANIVATSGSVSGQAALTVAAVPAPVASVAVSLAAGSLTAGGTTQATATLRDALGNVLTGRPLTWSSSNSTVATVSSTGLVTALAAGSANIVATSGIVSGQSALTVTSVVTPPTNATLLFEEHYEDTNLAARGWYDLSGTTPLSTVEHIPGSLSSLQVQYNVGTTTPANLASRHQFTPTNSVYMRYWVKYSSNWVGSGQQSHPHEFYLLTTEDAQYAGPAYNFLTMYIENNFQSGVGTATVASQDSKNIDVTRLHQDLTNVTEARAVSGCNGDPGGPIGDCYGSGTVWNNTRTLRSPQPVFLNTPGGTGYKNAWHQVEVFVQLNSIVNGKGMPDGIAQYWFDGQLVIDRHDLYLRTGLHPTMKFNQLIFGPFLGNGSSVVQTAWFDDLAVWTAHP